jgi:hypothetical protein
MVGAAIVAEEYEALEVNEAAEGGGAEPELVVDILRSLPRPLMPLLEFL